ncbi:alpha/beta fold hydrolase [Massilia pseudoviolaceinigra]|uniref:alpha/beta fold hydrolase n=1 Tax=Massilia pseudoviolaceinigra TaxID=3057165 RepID=UPI002796D181|nr:alpha/beta hydrolase [Massilia sp. CCM 9206]MDQ1923220.1 alpha/beta hydrolase [Massilia sp. CCM 9206]
MMLVCIMLAGCAVIDPSLRLQRADALAATAGWERRTLAAGDFALTSWSPAAAQSAVTLTVYVEGDGMAWLSASTVSPDPTPVQAMALQLALRHPRGAVAYLARPCQFQAGELPAACRSALWTDARYSRQVIDSMNAALDQLMQRAGARRLVLVGYSGGGVVAALLAARRADVVLLLTVAANLDTVAWARLQHLSPLAASLNPADYATQLARVPQQHWVGADDRVVPPAVLASYAALFPAGARPQVTVVPGFGHACCWQAGWTAMVTPLLPSGE